MIELLLPDWNTTVKFIQRSDNLPDIDCENLYLDFETTSQNQELMSVNPHRHCKILGIAFLIDAEEKPYYIPVRHCYLNENLQYVPYTGDFANYDVDRVHDWLKRIRFKKWINHNIKYDAHVWINELEHWPNCRMIDTMNLAKLSSFPEQFNYSLDAVLKLMGIDITHYEKDIKKHLDGKDYGLIPPDIMAPYAAVDTLAVRHIYKNIKIFEEAAYVVDMEEKLLPELIRMEQIGIHIDTDRMVKEAVSVTTEQAQRIDKIKELSGYHYFEPTKNKSLEELFVNRLGLDVDVTEKSREVYESTGDDEDLRYSFSKKSLINHIRDYPEIIGTYLDWKKNQKLLDGFLIPYLSTHLHKNNTVKASFNQIVRTGRLSCREPGLQQLSARAREFIIPISEDYVLVEFDLKQIEFRLIVHYINNKQCIEAYNANKDTDFHDWVAEMCGTSRKPAKNINFMMGYGGGKRKTVEMLTMLEEIYTDSSGLEVYSLAERIYDSYHKTLPELKPTQKRAEHVCRSRGYVRTGLGRPRVIPAQFAYKAFNSICQGTAADIQKYKTLALRKFLGTDCVQHLLVHDCWLFSIRKSRLEELKKEILDEIEKPIPEFPCKVPILSSCEVYETCWGKR